MAAQLPPAAPLRRVAHSAATRAASAHETEVNGHQPSRACGGKGKVRSTRDPCTSAPCLRRSAGRRASRKRGKGELRAATAPALGVPATARGRPRDEGGAGEETVAGTKPTCTNNWDTWGGLAADIRQPP